MNQEIYRSPMNNLFITFFRHRYKILIGSDDVGKIVPNYAENSPREGMNGWEL